jgi:ABC-type transporter Mla MlaB component
LWLLSPTQTVTGRRTHRSRRDEFRLAKRSRLQTGGPVVQSNTILVVDVRAVIDPDLGTVDALARLALTARRLGCRVRLEHASSDLRALLALAGLAEVVRCASGSGIERERKTEEREELLGVQEERDATDPAR